MDDINIKNFYIQQITDDFYPYWKKFEDQKYGGVLNCIDNRGEKLLAQDKFTWSQGRYLWVLSKLIELSENKSIGGLDLDHLKRQAKMTYEFIKTNAIYGDTRCYYLLDQKGGSMRDPVSGEYDASIFADCFALIGMAEYARILNVASEVKLVTSLYESIKRRILADNYKTEPYPIPEGYKNHSIPMIMVNTTYEFMLMLEHFGMDLDEHRNYLLELVEGILDDFHEDNLIREFVSNDNNRNVKMLDRHINPGHTIEDMWFIIEALQKYGNLEHYLETIILISKKTFNLGWDEEYGGLLRYVDKQGGPPVGEIDDFSYTRLIQDTHDMKLWWPHSEALYLPLLLHKLTGNEEHMDWYKEVHDYVFETFPNTEVGEWIQIRERDASPVEKVVALPVKDPFHILRNFIKIIEL